MNFVHYFVTFIESRPQSVLDTGEPLSDPVILMHNIDLVNNMQLHELTDSQYISDGNFTPTQEVLVFQEVLIQVAHNGHVPLSTIFRIRFIDWLFCFLW